jgi:Patatin-like phospholipase
MWRKPNWLTRCGRLSPWRQPPRLSSGDRKLRKLVPAWVRREVTQGRWGDTWSRRWRSLLLRERPEPIPSFRGPVECPPSREQERIGICCSGGGIRSAAFNLGALQALQCEEELQRASYLSAVSGGAYIAAAFSMVATPWEIGTDGKPSEDSDPELLEHEPPFAPGSPEEQYLRNRSSYMAPDGFGKLYIVYRALLGLLFNVAFLAAPLFAAMLIVGWLIYRPMYPRLVPGGSTGSIYHVPLGCWLAPAVIAGVSALIGLFVLLCRVRRDRVRRGLQVLSTRLLILAMLVALFSIGLPLLVALAHKIAEDLPLAEKASAKGVLGVYATGGGLAGLIAGVLAYVRETLLTPKKALTKIEEGSKALGSKVRTAVAYAAAAVAGPLLTIGVMGIALSVSLSYDSAKVTKWFGVALPLALGAGLLLVFLALYYVTDLTSLSLHPFYKRQLCTAFALRRVKAVVAYDIGPDQENELRQSAGGRKFLDTPVAIERKFNGLVKLSDTALDGARTASQAGAKATACCSSQTRSWPTLIVCAAANVADPGATPPGRPVTSFTFSARSVGGPLIGAVHTQQLEDAFDGTKHKGRARDLTLPSAVAISGAAVAPSMGKLTHQRPLRFLLALSNIRLGVWVPNPRWVEGGATPGEGSAKGSQHVYARPRPNYLIRELIGRNRVDSKYLFVTDGGHYENLGLVELLRRGCTEIYCFDASDDKNFSVLGDAIALARSELGVEIDIDPSELAPKEAGGTAANSVAYGKIRYRDEDKCHFSREGVLIYARCTLTAKAPWDVQAHHEEDPAFPHNSTADQLYTDQKFESYRALGEFVAGDAIERMGQARKGQLSASAPPPAGAPPKPAA